MRYVIGDVHGEFNLLNTLLDAIAPVADDQVYLLGDLIDRGSDSKAVVELVKNNPDQFQSIKGNHEELFLNAVEGDNEGSALWLLPQNGGQATLQSLGYGLGNLDEFLEDPMVEEWVEWMTGLPLSIDLGDYLLVHAGLTPGVAMEEQDPHALLWERNPKFFRSPVEVYPGRTVLVGHTPTFLDVLKNHAPGHITGELIQGQGWIALDTGAYNPAKGYLSALCLETQEVIQVSKATSEVRRLPLDEVSRVIESKP